MHGTTSPAKKKTKNLGFVDVLDLVSSLVELNKDNHHGSLDFEAFHSLPVGDAVGMLSLFFSLLIKTKIWLTGGKIKSKYKLHFVQIAPKRMNG